jgi:CheY-like chemotaxis protein
VRSIAPVTIAATILLLSLWIPNRAIAGGTEQQVCDVYADYSLGIEDYSKAIARHLEVVRKHPDSGLAHYHLGFSLGMVGDRMAEVREYQRAKALGLRSWDLLDRSSKSAKSELRETKEVGTISPATVLVVDDDPSVLRSLKRLLSASGFHVKTFDKPSDLLGSETPRSNACMVIDIDLPEMTGIEMCEVLEGSGRGLPSILITGRTDVRTRSLAAQANAVAVLFKPFEEDPLLEAIARAIALSSKDRSDI